MLRSFPLLLVLTTLSIFSATAFSENTEEVDWRGLNKEKIQLSLPLIIIQGEKGFLGCGYINGEVCNKTNEACGIVSGVMTHEDMLSSKLKFVSEPAKALGAKVGMSGAEFVELIR